jgi:hypothetical protein
MIPEVRQAMEKLFGPGGKMRLFVVKIDSQTALLAGATADQVAAMLAQLDRRNRIDWKLPSLATANSLLPQQADWRAFFSPHGYTHWSSRQMNAIVGVPVVGGPLVKDFPMSPPIGATGGVHDGRLWVEVSVPAETILGASEYLRAIRARPQR